MLSQHASSAAPVPPTQEGQLVAGRFTLGPLLAQDPLGPLHRARRTDGAAVVVQLIPPQRLQAEALRRAERDIAAAQALRHPHLLAVSELLLNNDGGLCVVREDLPGETLEARARRLGRPPAEAALDIAERVAAALATAHRKGLCHHHIGPQHVLLQRPASGGDIVRLIDLGLSALYQGEGAAGLLRAHYIAPEQVVNPRTADARADVYGLGLLLFELLCGKPPFLAADPAVLLSQHVNDVPPTLADRAPDRLFSAELEGLVASMLAKAPQNRPQHAALVLARLRQLRKAGDLVIVLDEREAALAPEWPIAGEEAAAAALGLPVLIDLGEEEDPTRTDVQAAAADAGPGVVPRRLPSAGEYSSRPPRRPPPAPAPQRLSRPSIPAVRAPSSPGVAAVPVRERAPTPAAVAAQPAPVVAAPAPAAPAPAPAPVKLPALLQSATAAPNAATMVVPPAPVPAPAPLQALVPDDAVPMPMELSTSDALAPLLLPSATGENEATPPRAGRVRAWLGEVVAVGQVRVKRGVWLGAGAGMALALAGVGWLWLAGSVPDVPPPRPSTHVALRPPPPRRPAAAAPGKAAPKSISATPGKAPAPAELAAAAPKQPAPAPAPARAPVAAAPPKAVVAAAPPKAPAPPPVHPAPPPQPEEAEVKAPPKPERVAHPRQHSEDDEDAAPRPRHVAREHRAERPPREPAAHPGAVTVRIISVPPGAQVSRDGQLIGTTPFSEAVPVRDRPLAYQVYRVGYESASVQVTPTQDRRVQLELSPMMSPK